MNNICLITYSKSANYGAALQLFATYEFLLENGYNVNVLDYQNSFETPVSFMGFLTSSSSIKEKLRFLISSYIFSVKRNSEKNFGELYQKLNYSVKVTNRIELQEMSQQYDVFCVGSDQVWNPKITNGFDDIFLLNAQLPKKISYASSMGSIDFTGYDENKLICSLREFDYISVREKKALDYLCEKHLNINIAQVVDPTFLLGKDGWNNVLKKYGCKHKIKNKYVLVYALGGNHEQCNSIAHKIAKIIKAEVVTISLSCRPKKVDKLITNANPFDFVSLIKNASFVVTNSFHGTCFSFMFEVPFYSIKFENNPIRAVELLEHYGLGNRIFDDQSCIESWAFSNDDLVVSKNAMANDVHSSATWFLEAINGK